MITMIENIGIAVLGIFFIVWLNTVKAGRGSFSYQIWVSENIWAITMSVIGIMLAATIHMSDPSALGLFHSLTGVDLNKTSGGWFTFSILLYSTVRKFEKPKKR